MQNIDIAHSYNGYAWGANMSQAELLSVAQASVKLGMSPMAIYAQCRKNRLPHIRVGDRVFIPREALRQWLAERNQEALSVVAPK